MKKRSFKSYGSYMMLGAFAAVLLMIGCKNDDPMMEVDPVASFQFEVDEENPLKIIFSNFSQNGQTYAWDFGDGGMSTDKDPEHTYAATGTYNVTLVATNSAGKTDDVTKPVLVEDPDVLLSILAGTTSKTWYLQREGIALGIGPDIDDTQWWSLGGVAPLGDRPCILDDQYTFHRDGKWEFNSDNTLFIDSDGNGGWLAVGEPEACHDESEPGVFMARTGEDVSAFGNGGDYTYEFDAVNNKITLNGLGAYIGLANKTADGDDYIPRDVKSYEVFGLTEGTIADSLKVAIVQDGAVWNFYLVSYHDINNLPDIPSVVPKAGFSFAKDNLTVTFTNTSNNSTTYLWDFGDGEMSTDKDPVHTYMDPGVYQVKLTASDDNMNSDEISMEVSVSAAVFSPSALSSESGKTWVLAGEFSYKVGPFPGSGEWWPGLDAAGVIERACQIDDEYIFFDDGRYQLNNQGETFAEAYMGGANACIEDDSIPAPYDVLGSGEHTFTSVDVMDPDPAKVTVTGLGAYIGFSKPFNGGELDGTNSPASEITYNVHDYTKTNDGETLTLAVDIAGDGTAWWTITLKTK